MIEAPVPTIVPPHDPLYHTQLAPVPSAPPLTDNVLVPPEHIAAGTAPADAGAVDDVLTVTVTLWHAVVLHVPTALT